MSKLPYILLAVALLFNLAAGAASAGEVKWSKVNIPGEGRAGNNLLAPDTDIRYLTGDGNGNYYACCEGTTTTLFRSTDGDSWQAFEENDSPVTAIATVPEDPDIIYYATEEAVFRSTDGGDSFRELSGTPGGAGSGHITITALAVTTIDDDNIIAVATRDSDAGEFGGVYLRNEARPFTGWTDTGIGSYDAYAVAFSPDFTGDERLVAVVTDETGTLVTTKCGGAGWGRTTGNAMLENDGAPLAVNDSAVIAFPDDYATNGESPLFVAVDTGNEEGDVYFIIGQEAPEASVVFDLNIGAEYRLGGIDITGLAVSGPADSACLLAGASGSAETYFSTDGGQSWAKSTKPPTGKTKTYVTLDAGEGLSLAATSGRGSAVSVSRDGGMTWNQNGLIDTKITSILDLAPSPQYQQDDTLFLLTWGKEHSLWRSRDGGDTWVRIFSSNHSEVDEIDRVALPPDYGDSSRTVFLSGSSDNQPVTWYSRDDGQEFAPRRTPLAVDAWIPAGDRTLFIAGYDGGCGRIYVSTNDGLSYSSGTAAGLQSLYSLAVSPDYDNNETVLAGNTNGWVFLSENGGKTFTPLPENAATAPLTGSISVAFDPDFENNRTVYAASDAPDGGIHRLRLDRDDGWESIDDSLPEDSMIGRIVLAGEGSLYAANFLTDGGLERCLYPTYSLGPTFETVTRGLEDGATLVGLRITGNQLWSIDTANNRLLTYTDSLTVPVTLTAPEDEAPGVGTMGSDDNVGGVSLDWESLAGATDYQWQLNYESGFDSVPEDLEGESAATGVRLPDLAPATTYYWRVRATGPVLSPWSAKWSFTTSLGTGVAAPHPYTPTAGNTGVNLRPVFQWSSIAGAEGYELLVAADSNFENKEVARTGDYAVNATAWECDVDLDPGSTYFWKVRATGNGSNSAWSDVYAFTTATPAAGTQSDQASPAAPAPPARAETDWTKWLVFTGIALLGIMTAILVTMIVLAARIRRY